MKLLKAVQVEVKGKVQKVPAISCPRTGLAGYVRNARDGEVGLFVQGAKLVRKFLSPAKTLLTISVKGLAIKEV